MAQINFEANIKNFDKEEMKKLAAEIDEEDKKLG